MLREVSRVCRQLRGAESANVDDVGLAFDLLLIL